MSVFDRLSEDEKAGLSVLAGAAVDAQASAVETAAWAAKEVAGANKRRDDAYASLRSALRMAGKVPPAQVTDVSLARDAAGALVSITTNE